MSNIITISKRDLIEVILESPDTKEIEQFATKHDCHRVVYVTKIEEKYYSFSIEYSYNEGMQLWDNYVKATEVKPVEKVITEWVPV